MAHVLVTLLDIAKRNGTDEIAGMIDECSAKVPELTRLFARPIKGINYTTWVRTALPSVGFRAANAGIENTKATRIQRLIEAFILDASWFLDTAVADSAEDGPDAECALQAQDHMEAALKAVAAQIFYGTAQDASGFPGFVSQVSSTMVVDATVTGMSQSFWGVVTGPKNVAMVLGQNGKIEEGEIVKQNMVLSSKNLWCYAQQVQGRVGMQIGNQYSIGRIRNLDDDPAATTHNLTDDLISALITKFLAAPGIERLPDFFIGHPYAISQLQQSRTATNGTGAPAPFPADAFGIPIISTTNLTVTETAA